MLRILLESSTGLFLYPEQIFAWIWALLCSNSKQDSVRIRSRILFESWVGFCSKHEQNSVRILIRILFESWEGLSSNPEQLECWFWFPSNPVPVFDFFRFLFSESYSVFNSDRIQDSVRILFKILLEFCSELCWKPVSDSARIMIRITLEFRSNLVLDSVWVLFKIPIEQILSKNPLEFCAVLRSNPFRDSTRFLSKIPLESCSGFW